MSNGILLLVRLVLGRPRCLPFSHPCTPLPGKGLMAFTLAGLEAFVSGRGHEAMGIVLWAHAR